MIRYFMNNLLDYNPSHPVNLQVETWRDKVFRFIAQIVNGQPATVRSTEGGLYVGIAGIAYMFLKISSLNAFSDRRAELLQLAKNYIDAALVYIEANEKNTRRDNTDRSAFLLGDPGIYAVAVGIFAALGDSKRLEMYWEKYMNCDILCKKHYDLPNGSDELFVGRAGFIIGALWLSNFRDVDQQFKLYDLCMKIVQSGREYSKKHKSPCPLMYSYYNVEYLGAAHGLCSILQTLLSVKGFAQSRKDVEKDIKDSVDFILSLQDESGNFPCAMDELGPNRRRDQDQLVHWCHGAPGVVYLMAKSYQTWKDEKYLNSCIACGELVWNRGLLKKGPGICHGVAGSGYVFLLLYRLTGDHKHLHRAQEFATFLDSLLFINESRVPDSPFSLFEGIAGTCCFLADLTEPLSSSFPFFDINSF